MYFLYCIWSLPCLKHPQSIYESQNSDTLADGDPPELTAHSLPSALKVHSSKLFHSFSLAMPSLRKIKQPRLRAVGISSPIGEDFKEDVFNKLAI